MYCDFCQKKNEFSQNLLCNLTNNAYFLPSNRIFFVQKHKIGSCCRFSFPVLHKQIFLTVNLLSAPRNLRLSSQRYRLMLSDKHDEFISFLALRCFRIFIRISESNHTSNSPIFRYLNYLPDFLFRNIAHDSGADAQ